MKYAAERFIFGFFSAFFIINAAVLYGSLVNRALCRQESFSPSSVLTIARQHLVPALPPLALGIYCLYRFRHWHGEALKMAEQQRTEPGA